MNADAFLAELDRLLAEHSRQRDNLACFEVQGCISCVDCVFCRDCERCYGARHSIGCRNGYDITHCVECSDCYACTFCEKCSHCAASNFLVLCTDCVGCDYCYGCVGLRGKDFHVLNQPYSRKEYFRIVAELKARLPIPTPGERSNGHTHGQGTRSEQ